MDFKLNMQRDNFAKKFTTIFLAVLVIGGLGFSMFKGDGGFFASSISLSRSVTLQTTKGAIIIELFDKESPNLAENFYWLAKSGKYSNVPFHRVIDGFMIQSGDFENQDGTGGTGFKDKYVADEFSENLTHTRGMVSMANKGPDTNGSQFFIVQDDAQFLDGRHSIIGKVTQGMDVVDTIAKSETDLKDSPIKEILIRKAIPN